MVENKREVLIVEDDQGLAAMIARALTRRSYEVVTASTCAEGIAAVRRQTPDVLLLDIGLPDGEGWQVLEAAQRLNARPVFDVVVMSANSIPRSLLRRRGVSRFLAKPFALAELLGIVCAGLFLV